MIHGIDTTFLIELEIIRHPRHRKTRTVFDRLVDAGDQFALAPQVLGEFIHAVTDERRFEFPLSSAQAIERSRMWWSAREIRHVFPNQPSTDQFLTWMHHHRLGRKRLLDTQLAATYFAAGITSILTSNARDYTVFGCFTILPD